MKAQDNGDNRLYYTMYRCVSAVEWRLMVAPFARPGRCLRTKDIPAELRIVRWEVLSLARTRSSSSSTTTDGRPLPGRRCSRELGKERGLFRGISPLLAHSPGLTDGGMDAGGSGRWLARAGTVTRSHWDGSSAPVACGCCCISANVEVSCA